MLEAYRKKCLGGENRPILRKCGQTAPMLSSGACWFNHRIKSSPDPTELRLQDEAFSLNSQSSEFPLDSTPPIHSSGTFKFNAFNPKQNALLNIIPFISPRPLKRCFICASFVKSGINTEDSGGGRGLFMRLYATV